MDIDIAYKLTKTRNKNQLAKFLGVSHVAVRKWEQRGEVPPGKFKEEILKAGGLYPDDADIDAVINPSKEATG